MSCKDGVLNSCLTHFLHLKYKATVNKSGKKLEEKNIGWLKGKINIFRDRKVGEFG